MAILPRDVVTEILLRLPMKPLVRSKIICKNWCSLIQCPAFISRHHDRAVSIAAASNTDCLLVKRFLNDGDGDGGNLVLSFVPNEIPVEDIDISVYDDQLVQYIEVFGPCKGVVCLARGGPFTPIVLCNPSMKEFRLLPQPSYKNDLHSTLGFGFSRSTGEFKVVRLGMLSYYSDGGSFEAVDERVEIYDLGTDSWRVVDAEPPIKFRCLCVFSCYASLNGDFFWGAHKEGGGSAIVMFSMTDEVFKELPVPESFGKLIVYKDSLATVVRSELERSFDIWVMNEEDVEVPWTRKFTIRPFPEGPYQALGLRQNGEFLVEREGQMMSYNVNTEEIKEYQVHFEPYTAQAVAYTESLVSVKRA